MFHKQRFQNHHSFHTWHGDLSLPDPIFRHSAFRPKCTRFGPKFTGFPQKMIILFIIELISTDIDPILTKIEWKMTQIQWILTKISQNLIQFQFVKTAFLSLHYIDDVVMANIRTSRQLKYSFFDSRMILIRNVITFVKSSYC